MGQMVRPVEDVEVMRLPDGRLQVTWKPTGDCDEVDVSWGRSADGLDHAHVLTVAAAGGEALIRPGRHEEPRPDAGRVYVSIAPALRDSVAGPGATIAAERRIGMQGPVNFRDLGGYRSLDGRTVRWGRVFRSDALVLEEADLEAFAGLGIGAVYDLRSEPERTAVPSRLPEDGAPEVVALPLIGEGQRSNPVSEFDFADGEVFLEQLYVHILDRSAANVGRILTGLSKHEHLPAVFHCAAGKDRTGLVAALLLSVLGVSQEDILDDYELTGRYRTTEHVKASAARLSGNTAFAPEVVAGILRAPRWAMQSALSQVAERYGSFDGYLTGPARADQEVPGRLRELLLAP